MLTVHHLNDSRSQRILWLCEELGIPYRTVDYTRDAVTRLAPPALRDVHPLGKSPVIEDGALQVTESGAITDYIIRTYGNGRMMPTPGSADHEKYLEWLHFAEGSAMLPFLMALYIGRLGEAGAPLHERIDEQMMSHLAFVESALGDKPFLLGDELTGADIMMSFVAEIAAVQGKLATLPRLLAYARRLQARPAWIAVADRTAPYSFRLPQ
ncbi:MAG: glutathione S-transferase family protein [Polymorphobacter sp.]